MVDVARAKPQQSSITIVSKYLLKEQNAGGALAQPFAMPGSWSRPAGPCGFCRGCPVLSMAQTQGRQPCQE